MFRTRGRLLAAVEFACAAALTAAAAAPSTALANGNFSENAETTTPIKHVIVIFGENISFDHYFGTYPFATNPRGEPPFHALPDTPHADNLLAGGLLDQNPNTTQPFRMDTGLLSVTCDQNHSYTPEWQEIDLVLSDKFPQCEGSSSPT